MDGDPFTIHLTEEEQDKIARWASVGRTLNNALQVCELALDHPISKEDEDRALLAVDELKDVTRMLDSLHHTVRNEIWKKRMF